MLEKFQKMLDDLKKQQNKELQEMSQEFIEELFEMIDLNKWLKSKAFTENQKKQTQQREDNLNGILKKLCVPQILTTNT